MRLAILWAAAALSLAAQTIAFSPQQVSAKGGQLTLWAVDVSAPGQASVPAAQIYAVAASHGVGHVDATLAQTILSTAAGRSPLAIGVKFLGAASALAAVATVVKNQGVVSSTTSSRIQNGAMVGAGVAAILLPYLQKEVPATPDPAIAAELLAGELKLGANGAGSALFYSLPSQVQAFMEKLP
jgi:hypothetical protein